MVIRHTQKLLLFHMGSVSGRIFQYVFPCGQTAAQIQRLHEIRYRMRFAVDSVQVELYAREIRMIYQIRNAGLYIFIKAGQKCGTPGRMFSPFIRPVAPGTHVAVSKRKNAFPIGAADKIPAFNTPWSDSQSAQVSTSFFFLPVKAESMA